MTILNGCSRVYAAVVLLCVIQVPLLTSVAHATSSGQLLHTFKYAAGGTTPMAPMISDAAGNLYGTTYDGGADNLGVVFELSVGGSGRVIETVLHTFGGTDGANPRGGLVMDAAGNLYGTTSSGGSSICIGATGFRCGVIFELNQSQTGWTETVLHSFTVGSSQDGYQPSGGLVIDPKGNLYGTTPSGGSFGGGTIFELNASKNGLEYSVIYNFDPLGQAASPFGPLVLDANGNLYGSTPRHSNDNFSNWGTIFELSPTQNGWNETVLYVFSGGNDGATPNGGLVLERAGSLYGTTQSGGRHAYGVVFRLAHNKSGWAEHVIHSFRGTDGRQPLSGLTADDSGNLYGTTNWGGNTCDFSGIGAGVVFMLTHASGKWEGAVVHKFNCGDDGKFPIASPNIGPDGNVYGTTSGGQYKFGTAFRLSRTPDGGVRESVIHTFADVDGQTPFGSLTLDSFGNLFGTTELGGSHNVGTAFELTPTLSGGWTRKIIYNFAGIPNDNNLPAGGGEPTGNLVIDSEGNLFGTTFAGGNISCRGQPCGTVFELSPSPTGWTETTLYEFKGGIDGGQPNSGLALDSEGNLYGTTSYGGGAFGYGTVFELSPGIAGWTETVLYAFRGNGDGIGPAGGVILDSAGNLYGTTEAGGTGGGQGCDPSYSCGTVFELVRASGWTEQILHSFAGSDGNLPVGTLTLDADGNLYGTTAYGGAGGRGTVFELTPNNGHWIESVLYGFSGHDGDHPIAGVTFDSAGNLYGTTTNGGTDSCISGCGVAFKLTPIGSGEWQETTLYSFTGGKDGGNPASGLIMDSSGSLYGTAQTGGVGIGVVFGFTP